MTASNEFYLRPTSKYVVLFQLIKYSSHAWYNNLIQLMWWWLCFILAKWKFVSNFRYISQRDTSRNHSLGDCLNHYVHQRPTRNSSPNSNFHSSFIRIWSINTHRNCRRRLSWIDCGYLVVFPSPTLQYIIRGQLVNWRQFRFKCPAKRNENLGRAVEFR